MRNFDWPAAASAVLILLAILFGGGGSEAPFRAGLLEGLGALLLAFLTSRHFTGRPLPDEASGPVVFFGLAFLLVAAQLAPLPPSIWMNLPGREAAVSAVHAAGLKDVWRPLSLDPEATRRTAGALVLPLAIALASIASTQGGKIWILRSLLTGALLSAVLGMFQIALGNPEALAPYGRPTLGVASGLFANPNHQGALMVSAIVATGMLIRVEPAHSDVRIYGRRLELHLGWLLLPVFVAMAVACQSRAILILLLPAVAAAIAVAKGGRSATRLIAVSAVGLLAAVAIFLISPGAMEAMSKFQASLGEERRLIDLPDIVFTLGQFWPWGSGLGTFVPVYQANEDLDLIRSTFLNHAHNDLLELLVEAGLPGAVLLLLAAAGFGWRLRRILARRGPKAMPSLGAFALLAFLLLHSLIDYPLRTDALAAVAGAAIGLFVAPVDENDRRSGRSSKKRRRRGFRTMLGTSPSTGGLAGRSAQAPSTMESTRMSGPAASGRRPL